LKIKKPRFFNYKAGQTVFLKIPHLSWLEWHPFSIASAPADEHVEFLIDCSHGEKTGTKTWTRKLFAMCDAKGAVQELQPIGSHGAPKKGGESVGNLKAYIYGPCGSSFQSFENHKGIMLIGGGSGLPSSLSVLRHVFNCRRGLRKIKAEKVSFVWSTRHVESILWCWDHLKSCIETEVGYQKRTKWTQEHEQELSKLSGWLEISINVTQMSKEALNRLVDIEKNSAVGSWLVHRLNAGRITGWDSIFRRFQSNVGSKEIKVFFCGPGQLVAQIRAAAKTITGFNIEVSSENFHDS